MPSLADGLPPEIAALVHPEWRANEQAYWAVRDSLLAEYGGQWVAFADGAVIASGRDPVEILHAAVASGRHPFYIRVGAENEPTRIRLSTFPDEGVDQGERPGRGGRRQPVTDSEDCECRLSWTG
jgi:hypothetical protein